MGYLAHFGLICAPFSTTPDPAFAYATKEHQLAIAKSNTSWMSAKGSFSCRKTTAPE